MTKKDKDKVQIGIYKIDKGLFDGLSDAEIVDSIIDTYNKKVDLDEHFTLQQNQKTYDSFTVKIYYAKKKTDTKMASVSCSCFSRRSPVVGW